MPTKMVRRRLTTNVLKTDPLIHLPKKRGRNIEGDKESEKATILSEKKVKPTKLWDRHGVW
jgi:hypothetical protein